MVLCCVVLCSNLYALYSPELSLLRSTYIAVAALLSSSRCCGRVAGGSSLSSHRARPAVGQQSHAARTKIKSPQRKAEKIEKIQNQSSRIIQKRTVDLLRFNEDLRRRVNATEVNYSNSLTYRCCDWSSFPAYQSCLVLQIRYTD